MYVIMKRIMDFMLASISLILLLPVFLILIIAIKLDSKGPIFFRQKRIGRNKRCFFIIKFRTMCLDTPKDLPTHLFPDPQKYITRIGRLLRRTSLDELPQLWNIIVGEMSIVGPRPALWNQYDLIEERDKYGANQVRPGLTGLAQTNGRDKLLIPDKAKLDGDYVKHMGLFLDIRCILNTVRYIIKREGVVEGGTGSMSLTTELVNVSNMILKEDRMGSRMDERIENGMASKSDDIIKDRKEVEKEDIMKDGMKNGVEVEKEDIMRDGIEN